MDFPLAKNGMLNKVNRSKVRNMLIRAEHLTKNVMVGTQPLVILQDISLDIESSESLAIVGVSGSGKSTLLGLLAGLDLPTHGSVKLNGMDLSRLNEEQRAKLRAREIGFIFQNFQLLPNLTALENVMLPLELHNIKKRIRKLKNYLKK